MAQKGIAMRLNGIRLIVQHLSFFILTYGGRFFGLYLGSVMPCFSCPFVTGCAGSCYLMGLQGNFGLRLTAGLQALKNFALFVALVAVFGKTWCGWICPFGLVQDWLTALRKKIGLRESRISPRTMAGLGWIKYALLAYLLVLPPLITAGFFHSDFYLPFCSICPAKAIMPLFIGNTNYLSLDLTNIVTTGFSVSLLIITGAMLAGMFVKERFFCVFCPLLALIHILKPLNALRLVKLPSRCIGCGSCRRVCPMDIEKVFREKEKSDVQVSACLTCGTCIESCAADRALGLRWLGVKIVESSRRLALGLKRGKK